MFSCALSVDADASLNNNLYPLFAPLPKKTYQIF